MTFDGVGCAFRVVLGRNQTMGLFALTLVRHGQTEFNKEKIIQGHLNVPLSAVGRQQARLLGHRLQNEMFTHVYSSDLTRAVETAKGILKENRASNCVIIEDRLLRERKFGVMEGKSVKCLEEAANKVNMQIKSFTPQNGETLQQVHERAVAFFLQLCKHMLEDIVQFDDNSSTANQSSEKVQIQLSTWKHKKSVSAETMKSCLAPSSNESDMTATTANVLVVSHGGLLAKLVCYLVEVCGCSLPGGPKQASKIAPNGSFSKFIICVKKDSVPQVECLHFHDQQHLEDLHDSREDIYAAESF